jgi:hypothetical protein
VNFGCGYGVNSIVLALAGAKVIGKEQRLKIDLEQVLTEGEFKLLPPLLADDTIFVPKLKPEKRIWRTFMQIVANVSTLVVVYLIITGKR